MVFVVGNNDGHLYENYYNGSTWMWEPQGLPTTTTGGVSAPAAHDDPALARTYVFVAGTDARLYDKYYNGSSWIWEHKDTPGVTTISGTGAWGPAVAYLSALHRLVVFVVGADGKAYDKYSDDGSTWVGLGARGISIAELEKTPLGLRPRRSTRVRQLAPGPRHNMGVEEG